MIYFLLLLIIIQFVVIFFSIKNNIKAGMELRSYDDFFERTTEDIQEVIKYIDMLMKREIVSSDPDVQNLRKSISLAYEVLMGYLNAKK